MNLIFERLQEKDILQLRDISDEFVSIEPRQIIPFLEEKHNIAFVAKLDDTVIGLIYGYSLTDFEDGTTQFFIYSVDIHTEYQNKGYGSLFINYVLKWVKDNKFRECFVIADEDNARACRVYEKAGMVVTNTKQFEMKFPENY